MASQQRERQTTIVAAIRGIFAALSAWGQSAKEMVTDELEKAVDRFLSIAVVPASDDPQFATIEAIAVRLSAAWDAWKEFAERTQLTRNLPESPFWDALAELPASMVSLAYPPPAPLEPLASLVKQLENSPGGRGQIVRMYGFFDEQCNPHSEWIDDELAKPGSRTGPDTGWKHPLQRRREAQYAEELSDMGEALALANAKRARMERSCQESIEQLVAAGVNLQQIVRMTHKSESDVLAYCEKHGCPHPAPSPNLLAGRSVYDKELTAEQSERFDREQSLSTSGKDAGRTVAGRTLPPGAGAVRIALPASPDADGSSTTVAELPESSPDSQPESIERQIVRLYQGGHNAAVIAKELREQGVTRAKADAVIKRFDDNPELFL